MSAPLVRHGWTIAFQPQLFARQVVELKAEVKRLKLSSDIRFWSSGDTKTGPPDGLLMGALRRLLDRCFIGGCRVVVVGCGICAA
jgi:hypothetical protein